jgi:hypothetical protein
MEDLAELRARVWRMEDRLFMFVEVAHATPLTEDVMFDRLEELAAGLDRFGFVVDLTGMFRPDAATRARLRQRVGRIIPRVAHVGLVASHNPVMRAMMRLVAFAIGLRSFSFHAAIDEAAEACRRALA